MTSRQFLLDLAKGQRFHLSKASASAQPPAKNDVSEASGGHNLNQMMRPFQLQRTVHTVTE